MGNSFSTNNSNKDIDNLRPDTTRIASESSEYAFLVEKIRRNQIINDNEMAFVRNWCKNNIEIDPAIVMLVIQSKNRIIKLKEELSQLEKSNVPKKIKYHKNESKEHIYSTEEEKLDVLMSQYQNLLEINKSLKNEIETQLNEQFLNVTS